MAKYIEYYDKLSSLAYVISCDIKKYNEKLITSYDSLDKKPTDEVINEANDLIARIEALSVMLNKVNSLSEFALNLHIAERSWKMDINKIIDKISNSLSDDINMLQDMMIYISKQNTNLHSKLTDENERSPLVCELDNRANSQIETLKCIKQTLMATVTTIKSLKRS